MSFFANSGGVGDYIKWDDTKIGQPLEMEIAGRYNTRLSKFNGEVRRNMAGEPQYEAVIPVLIEGEPFQLVVNKWRLQSAIGAAVQITGAPDLEIGGVLTVVYTGKEPAKKGGGMAQKFSASYKRGDKGVATPVPSAEFIDHADQAVAVANDNRAQPADPYADVPAPTSSPWDRV